MFNSHAKVHGATPTVTQQARMETRCLAHLGCDAPFAVLLPQLAEMEPVEVIILRPGAGRQQVLVVVVVGQAADWADGPG